MMASQPEPEGSAVQVSSYCSLRSSWRYINTNCTLHSPLVQYVVAVCVISGYCFGRASPRMISMQLFLSLLMDCANESFIDRLTSLDPLTRTACPSRLRQQSLPRGSQHWRKTIGGSGRWPKVLTSNERVNIDFDQRLPSSYPLP